MPDLIRHPEASIVLFPGFRLVGRNDKSLRDNQKLASPEGEGFQPSPKGTLIAINAHTPSGIKKIGQIDRFLFYKSCAQRLPAEKFKDRYQACRSR